MQLITDCKSY